MSENSKRIIQFDALRVIAVFAVVFLHTTAQRFTDCYPSEEWVVRCCYFSLPRWAVPVFLMISGALFLNLDKKIELKKLYLKNITRIVLIYVFWSTVYALYIGIGKYDLKGIASLIVYGPIHFWFLKVLIGLYICVPILRTIVTNKKSEQYFIFLSSITAFIIPLVFQLIGLFNADTFHSLSRIYNGFAIPVASTYACYFVLGHYLSQFSISVKVKKIVYFLGVVSVIPVIVLTYLVTSRIGTPTELFYDNNCIFTFFEAIAVFVFLKDLQIPSKYHHCLLSLSKMSLGVYIVHQLVIRLFYQFWGIHSASLNPVFFIPVFAVLVFVISCIIVYILLKIPYVRKLVM